MFVQIYIEALLVDEELADLVWELSEAGLIPDEMAALVWSSIFKTRVCLLGQQQFTNPANTLMHCIND